MKPHAALDPTTIDSDRKLLNNSLKIGDRDLLSKYNSLQFVLSITILFGATSDPIR